MTNTSFTRKLVHMAGVRAVNRLHTIVSDNRLPESTQGQIRASIATVGLANQLLESASFLDALALETLSHQCVAAEQLADALDRMILETNQRQAEASRNAALESKRKTRKVKQNGETNSSNPLQRVQPATPTPKPSAEDSQATGSGSIGTPTTDQTN